MFALTAFFYRKQTAYDFPDDDCAFFDPCEDIERSPGFLLPTEHFDLCDLEECVTSEVDPNAKEAQDVLHSAAADIQDAVFDGFEMSVEEGFPIPEDGFCNDPKFLEGMLLLPQHKGSSSPSTWGKIISDEHETSSGFQISSLDDEFRNHHGADQPRCKVLHECVRDVFFLDSAHEADVDFVN